MYDAIEQAAGTILDVVQTRFAERKNLRIAIDGRCASGKSLLAAHLQQATDCTVLHMDDFYLQPKDRTPERLQQPGGNVDRERFLKEVLQPLCRGEAVAYRRYNCHTKAMEPAVPVLPAPLVVTEGAYSCHPDLWAAYDLHVFLTASLPTQLARIEKRNGKQALTVFKEKWIPLEETYFRAFNIEKRCALHFCTDEGKH